MASCIQNLQTNSPKKLFVIRLATIVSPLNQFLLTSSFKYMINHNNLYTFLLPIYQIHISMYQPTFSSWSSVAPATCNIAAAAISWQDFCLLRTGTWEGSCEQSWWHREKSWAISLWWCSHLSAKFQATFSSQLSSLCCVGVHLMEEARVLAWVRWSTMLLMKALMGEIS